MARGVLTRNDILDTIRRFHDQLSKLGVRSVGLFGSFARGEESASSDIDILLEFEGGKKSFDNFMEACFLFENAFERKVEVVTPEGLSPYIKPQVMKEIEYVSFAS